MRSNITKSITLPGHLLLIALAGLGSMAWAQTPYVSPVEPPAKKPTPAAPTAVPAPKPSAPANGTPVNPVPAPANPAPTAVAPVAPPAPPVVLPKLTEAQAGQLRAWLGDLIGQGLARSAPAAGATPPEGDTLVTAALDRARAIHSGRLDTTDFLKIWALRPDTYDPLPGFADAVARDRIGSWIANLSPPYAGYDGLKKGLSTYRLIAANGGWQSIPAGPDFGLGATGPRVVALRTRLAIEDREVPATGARFDTALQDAVVRAQKRYGLNPTGVAGPQTVAALNVSVADRIGAIMANMERWRWMPRELPTHRIQVNIAAAVLTVFEGDAPVKSMRAVTGRPGDETPMLSSMIHSVVINPPWNVPSGIAAKELWPKGKAYLAAHGYKIIGTPEGGQRLQQAAGPESALGRLKFDFDNPFAVYLHDTPSRGKFASYDRLASHGCVRLEKPVDLAELVLRDDPKWAGAVQSGIDEGKTQRVMLPEKISVYLLYWTAFASANGAMNFRDDPYGWDRLLASKIEARTRSVQPSLAMVGTK